MRERPARSPECPGGYPRRVNERRYLRIYLAERLTLAHGIRQLARRVAAGHSAPVAAEAVRVLDDDVAALTSLLRQLGARPPRARIGLVAVVERLGRLKLNGRLGARSPLSDLQELDGLVLGAVALSRGWAALDHADVVAEDVIGGRADRLAALADRLDAARGPVARRALAGTR